MNIYIRQQDNDLFKYLSDEEYQTLKAKCIVRKLKLGEELTHQEISGIVMLESGILQRLSPNKTACGQLFPGEIDFELSEALPYTLKAVTASQISILSYIQKEQLTDPLLCTKLEAAINDALCLKIIRLTHGE
ncbi:MAG: hypothetical protein RBR69_09585 [Candidatus Cloacimonadaceae bacterium]|jgi:hypothetical protein|nr:hypothetical protein [Candidatus Cloacimonadota bacterium]MDY0128368.1 hypothetical protein [Candidatus Cloacimonadaceae bacterium]MCB5254406.1 hypothetical protein [Candidatus Cloacimonadota bacterium]MCK9178904.1 hypothetical protein [Candidatus Cloacimonadota bacterium]MCK9243052.1 hypothetical protein [Candidatus Cloacimonadota bacterium]